MRRRLLRRPSPALVVACLALAVSLGGTSYAAFVLPANSVGTVQLKAGAVVSGKVRNGTLLLADVQAGQLESRFFTRAQADARFLRATTVASPPNASVDPGNFALQLVQCPSGEQAIGGGVDVGNVTTVRVAASHPTLAGQPPGLLPLPTGTLPAATGWRGVVYNSGTSMQPFRVVAVCAPIG
jgi:hypothetical protein